MADGLHFVLATPKPKPNNLLGDPLLALAAKCGGDRFVRAAEPESIVLPKMHWGRLKRSLGGTIRFALAHSTSETNATEVETYELLGTPTAMVRCLWCSGRNVGWQELWGGHFSRLLLQRMMVESPLISTEVSIHLRVHTFCHVSSTRSAEPLPFAIEAGRRRRGSIDCSRSGPSIRNSIVASHFSFPPS